MSITIEIPNVPDALYARIETRAREAGLSMSDYLLRELAERVNNEEALRKLMRESLDRLKSQPIVELKESPAEIIRRARDAG